MTKSPPSRSPSELQAVLEENSSVYRIPGLDGVRGIAISLVLIYHATGFGQGVSTGLLHSLYRTITLLGWVGVDLFFVLSGFLITGILLDTREDPNYFKNFYARRTLRIFPLYYGFLLLAFMAGLVFPAMAWKGMLSALTYTTNFTVAFHGEWDVVSRPIHHFWSLAVEEQFYLVWPLLVFFLSPRKLWWTVIGIILLTPFVRLGLHLGITSISAYVLTIARMDGLAMGALLALLVRREGELLSYRPYAWGGLLIGTATFASVAVWRVGFHNYDKVIRVGGFSIVALLAVCGLILVLTDRPRGLLMRFLQQPWLTALGKYSYAIYIFHQPVLVGLLTMGISVPMLSSHVGSGVLAELLFFTLAGGASLLLAYISWHLLEKHFLKLKQYFSYQ